MDNQQPVTSSRVPIVPTILLIITVMLCLYTIFHIPKPTSTLIQTSQHVIDSLNNEIVKLDSIHTKQDSVIVIYKDSIIYIDKVITTEKIKYVKIKQKYNEIRNHVTHYTHTQLDSFFTKRYGYLKDSTTLPNR